MNFSEVLTHVLRITARPDKTLDATLAINRAVSYMTLLGDFARDVVETSIAIDDTIYGDTVSLSALTRFRKFTYVKPTAVKYYLKYLPADKIFTPKDNTQPNVYYISGTSLTYTLSALTDTLEVGYLTYPITLDDTVNTTHWLLDSCPYAVIDLACAYVFSRIGDDSSAKTHQNLGMEAFLSFRKDLSMEM